ncbi:DUF397 domain-containing protein [Amycolatopsis sp. NPDC098790]|uniref:DUF397 domain-containing protein n=1 Tax=Amycolatopsis sp. NPDC098790 TaxID=3363939 RepID=UPI0037F43C56
MPNLHWRKSTYSVGGNEADCVEVAVAVDMVMVRDSKAPASGTLTVSAETWRHIGEITR